MQVVNDACTTLETIKKCFATSDIRFLIFKTVIDNDCSYLRDIDVLVDKYRESLHVLSTNGFTVFETGNHKSICFRSGLLRVNLHKEINWDDSEFLDVASVFQRARKGRISNVEVLVPSFEDDILTHCAHWIFQRGYVSLSDFHYVKRLLEEHGKSFDWGYILEKSAKHGWPLGLRTSLNLIEILNRKSYNKTILPNITLKQLRISWFFEVLLRNVEFPHIIPLMVITINRNVKLLFDLKKMGSVRKMMNRCLAHFFGLFVLAFYVLHRKVCVSLRLANAQRDVKW